MIIMAKNKKNEIEGFAFVGFFFLGFSIGPLLGRWDAAPFLALALAFIAMAYVKATRK